MATLLATYPAMVIHQLHQPQEQAAPPATSDQAQAQAVAPLARASPGLAALAALQALLTSAHQPQATKTEGLGSHPLLQYMHSLLSSSGAPPAAAAAPGPLAPGLNHTAHPAPQQAQRADTTPAQAPASAHLAAQRAALVAQLAALAKTQAAAASEAAPPSPGQQTSGNNSSRHTAQEEAGQPQVDMRGAAAVGVAGLKLPVTCNEVRGIVYLDQQVVACYCAGCSDRVAAGHDRPLFSFTRWERHTGSRAKKWRLSLRIEPGAVPECRPGDPPLSLGQWLEMKGLMGLAPRRGGDEGEGDELTPAPGGPPPVLGALAAPPAKRQRRADGHAAQYACPDPPEQAGADPGAWLAARAAEFEAAAGSGGGLPAKHAAIFRLVYGVLRGEERRAFNEDYLPWLNDLGPHRLECEFSTLASYLTMLGGGPGGAGAAPPGAVGGLLLAYLRGVLARLGE